MSSRHRTLRTEPVRFRRAAGPLSVPHQIVQESSHDSVLSSSLLAVSG